MTTITDVGADNIRGRRIDFLRTVSRQNGSLPDSIVSGEGVRALPDVASDTSATRAAPSLNYTLQQSRSVAS
ncbi:unnamed protein product [Colias eurytheme]|nr:unnamed protein product [Colias eurytheme]